MARFTVCPACGGSGASSAYLGAFTSEDIAEMDDEFMEDYFEGRFDRKCTTCDGNNVVPLCKIADCDEEVAIIDGYWSGRIVSSEGKCFEHDADMRDMAEGEAQGAAERAYGC